MELKSIAFVQLELQKENRKETVQKKIKNKVT